MTTSIVPQTTDTDRAVAQAVRQAYGLRALADFIEANPELSDTFRYPLSYMNVPIGSQQDQKAVLAAVARAAAADGIEVRKTTSGTNDQFFQINLDFAGMSIQVYGDRDEVCERVVVGTREVTEEVPDPEALAAVPVVVVTKTVEDVEWRCGSLLAGQS